MATLKNSTFHPFEIAFCGYSNSGKTTLIEKLVKQFSKTFDVGVVKHDAHHFELDHDGKDSKRFVDAGAHTVVIGNDKKTAYQVNQANSEFELKEKLLAADFVIVEGHKKLKLPKLLVVDDKAEIFDEYRRGGLENVLALVLKNPQHQKELNFDTDLPIFFRDDVQKISNFVLDFFKEQIPPVKALILAGGKSSRMGSDKGALNYHGSEQTLHLSNLLGKFVKEVYVSIRAEQKNQSHLKDLPQIEDNYKNLGPTSGILSSFDHDPNACWLVIAVDLPYINEQAIKELLKARNPFKMATCFINADKGWPEPLCTLWEPKSRPKLHWFTGIGRSCPRKVLFNGPIKAFAPANINAMENCNTPEDYNQALQLIGEVSK